MKRANGRGGIQRHGSRWRVRVSVGGRRRTLAMCDTEEEARRLLAAFLAQREAGTIETVDALTLGRLGAAWLDRREVDGSALRAEVKSISHERSIWGRHVATSALASLAVKSIRVRDVEAYVRWLRRREAVTALRMREGTRLRATGRTISAQLQRHALRLVRQVLDEAVRLEHIATNPAAAVTLAKGERAVDDHEDWLRAGEIDRLLACDAISRRDRTVYAAAIGLGLRLGDLKSLRREHVRLEGDDPHVLARVHKSDRWHRVPVLPWLRPVLEGHLAELGDPPHPWMFPTRDGDRYASGRFNFGWSEKRARVSGEVRRRPPALERAGIARRIRFHDLRGTCATHLAIGTWGRAWTLTEVQQFLAHADQRTTERYVRRAQTMLSRAAAETLGGPAVGPALGQPIAQVPTDPKGFEPLTSGSGGQRSIQLS